MIRRPDNMIVDVVVRLMVPAIQIFAFYVIFHGHYSPGGGFQGGALLAGSILLQRVALGTERSQLSFPVRYGLPFGIIGVSIFAGTGLFAFIMGGQYLQYDAMPFGLTPVGLRNTGILLVELGVAFAVMGVLVSIYDSLACSSDEEGGPC